MKFSKNNSGFSLIEAMVGVAIISIMALTITRFSEVRKTSKVGKLSTSCTTVAKSVVDYVKDASVSANFSSYFYGSDGGDYSTNAITNIGNRVNGGDAWSSTSAATTPFFNLSGANAQTNTFLLMESSLRVLTSIYNSAGWVPNTFRAYPRITGNTTFGYIVDETQKNTGAAPTILISVTPYNIVTKDLILPPAQTAPLFIRPVGGAGAAPPVTVSHAPTSRDDVGMRLGVEVRYTADGVLQSCQTTHDFQYPPDTSAPTIDSLELTQNEYVGGGQNPNRTACDAVNDTDSTVQVRLNVSAGNFEEGLVFLCRDTSVSSSYPALPGGPNYPANSGHHPCNVPPATSPERYGVGTDSTPATQAPPSSPGGGVGGGWTTCDQVTLCGETISGFSVNGDPGSLDRAGNSTTRVQLVMDYTIAAGTYCEFGMQAIAIDSAGNSSAPATSLTEPATIAEFGTTNPSLPTHYTSTRNNITADGSASGAAAGLLASLYHDSRPTFGKAPPHCTTTPLCTDPADGVHDWHPNWNTQFPDGYYTCAASCCEITPPVAPAVIPITGTTSDACHPYSP